MKMKALVWMRNEGMSLRSCRGREICERGVLGGKEEGEENNS